MTRFHFYCIVLVLIFGTLNCKDISSEYYRLDSDFKKIIWLDDSTIIIAGTNGTILISNDQGFTWKHNFSSTHHNLNDIFKINSDKVIAVGDNGTLLLSKDKGNSWTKLAFSSLTDLKTVSFIDENLGIIGGTNGFLQITKDGGYTWTNIKFSDSNSIIASYVKDNIIYLADNQNNLFISSDFGNIWEKNTKGYNGTFCNFSESNDRIFFLSTTDINMSKDSGKTWNSYPIGFDVKYLSNFNQFDALILSPIIKSYINAYRIKLISDSFQIENLTVNLDTLYPTRSQFESAAFNQQNFGIAVGSNNSIFRTTNGGIDWIMVSDYDNFEKNSSSIQFLDSFTGFLGAFYGTIYRTVDGGATFLPQKRFSLDIAETNIFGIYFKDKLNGIAVNNGIKNFMRTSNGGDIFSNENKPIVSNEINIRFVNDSNFIFSGYTLHYIGPQAIPWAAFGYTTDQLKSITIYRIDSAIFKSCEIINSNTFIVGGIKYGIINKDTITSQAFISTSSNKGLNWTYKTLDFINEVSSLEFINENTGFLSGFVKVDNKMKNDYLKVFKTTDGGKSWYSIISDSNHLLNMGARFVFNHSDTGFVGGLNFSMTTDRGEHWETYSDTSWKMTKLIANKIGSTIYIRGNGNGLLKSIDQSKLDIMSELKKIKINANPFKLISIFPNPAKDKINIELEFNIEFQSYPIKFEIYNSMGEKITRCTIPDIIPNKDGKFIFTSQTSSLVPGVYFVVLSLNSFSSSLPFVIY